MGFLKYIGFSLVFSRKNISYCAGLLICRFCRQKKFRARNNKTNIEQKKNKDHPKDWGLPWLSSEKQKKNICIPLDMKLVEVMSSKYM